MQLKKYRLPLLCVLICLSFIIILVVINANIYAKALAIPYTEAEVVEENTEDTETEIDLQLLQGDFSKNNEYGDTVTFICADSIDPMIPNANTIGNVEDNTDEVFTDEVVTYTPITGALPTETVIAMSEEDLWLSISDGAYHSYSEANAAAQADFEGQEQFWSSKVVPLRIPIKRIVGDEIKCATATIYVNYRLTQYFYDYFSDLYNLEEDYCIKNVSAFSYRSKNNGTNTSNLSGHSFGAAVDINWSVDGMGSVPAHGDGIGSGNIVITSDELDDIQKHYVETLDSSWYALTTRYKLDWGGLWSYNYRDPMHHSVIGDTNKDSRNYNIAPSYNGIINSHTGTDIIFNYMDIDTILQKKPKIVVNIKPEETNIENSNETENTENTTEETINTDTTTETTNIE